MKEIEFLSEAKKLQSRTVALRRSIHRYPELGNELPKTRQSVLDAIDDLNLEIALSKSTSGLVATLTGDRSGPTIILRGDMDALPMPEDTGLEFASQVDGCMHACGHDAHTAMLASAARLLSQHQNQLPGTVKFMFQSGEEGPGGAEPMLNEGLLGDDISAAFALHIYPNVESGVVTTRPGPFLAAADTISIKLTGRGGHGSMPYLANDPVPVACEIVHAIQTFISRRVPTFDPVVLTFGQISAGTVNNVIPEHALMEATLRSFSIESQTLAVQGIERVASNVAAAHEMTVEVSVVTGYPVTRNDAHFVSFVEQTARRVLGQNSFCEMRDPNMGAEDFSLVLERYPGAMAFIGVAPPNTDPELCAPCHSNRMLLDEDALSSGVAMHCAVAWDYLQAPQSAVVAS